MVANRSRHSFPGIRAPPSGCILDLGGSLEPSSGCVCPSIRRFRRRCFGVRLVSSAHRLGVRRTRTRVGTRGWLVVLAHV